MEVVTLVTNIVYLPTEYSYIGVYINEKRMGIMPQVWMYP